MTPMLMTTLLPLPMILSACGIPVSCSHSCRLPFFGNDCCRAAAQVALYRILERHHPGIPDEDDSSRHCRLICGCCRDLRLLGRLSLRCCGCLRLYRSDLILRRICCCFIADVANLAANLYKIPAGVGLPPSPNGISRRHGRKLLPRYGPAASGQQHFCHIHQSRRTELLHHKARHLNLYGCQVSLPPAASSPARIPQALPSELQPEFLPFFISFFMLPLISALRVGLVVFMSSALYIHHTKYRRKAKAILLL